jgi:lactoylglutathione lyase
MKIKHIDHINMNVRDLDESVSWYNTMFGFEVVETGTYDGRPWAIILSGESQLCMYQRSNPDAAFKPNADINHFSFAIENRSEWERILERTKTQVHFGGEVKYPHSSSWYVDDPTGYEIEVVHWKGGRAQFPNIKTSN